MATLSRAASTFLVLLAACAVWAAPSIQKRATLQTLSASQIAAFKPFSFFAATAYCNPSVTRTWKCGADCNANADFIPVASGGNGASVQFWYVGFSPSQKTVIVAHEGTDFSKIQAVATDADAIRKPLSSSLFPGISTSITVHSGFANEHAKTATQVLAAVNSAISAHNATQVTVVGHSLGGAIALLDGVYLPLHIRGVTFRTITYGMPRVGNQAFANYVDSHLSLNRIVNKEDLAPIVPGRFLGYHHPSAELHIQDSGSWLACPGQDNTDKKCIVGDVSNIFKGSGADHVGPYDGVMMGC